MIGAFVFSKLINIDLAYKLETSEFKCKCFRLDCNYSLVNNKLLTMWNSARKDFGKPLKINSGHRCQKHNEEVGGLQNSKHLIGSAIDISYDEFSEEEIAELYNILRKYFDVVLRYDTFFHCHIY